MLDLEQNALPLEQAYKDPLKYLQRHVGYKAVLGPRFDAYLQGTFHRKAHFEFADRATIPYIKGREYRLVTESINLMMMMEPDADLSKSIPFPEHDVLMTLPNLTKLEDLRITAPAKFDELLSSLATEFFDKFLVPTSEVSESLL